jgi:hypothetical protein
LYEFIRALSGYAIPQNPQEENSLLHAFKKLSTIETKMVFSSHSQGQNASLRKHHTWKTAMKRAHLGVSKQM